MFDENIFLEYYKLIPIPAIKWVKLKQFSQLTGITEMAVRKKRHEGKWGEQIVKTAKDGMLYVNIEELLRNIKDGSNCLDTPGC
jgi:hypothetical protein